MGLLLFKRQRCGDSKKRSTAVPLRKIISKIKLPCLVADKETTERQRHNRVTRRQSLPNLFIGSNRIRLE